MAQTSQHRVPIRRLSPLVVNQIAAGEVIERPASVVKELMDNAIDSGASRIVVEIERGGIELVRVTDDGRGIPPEELPLAIEAHATSKIAVAEDLDRIATMGFRGEALASVASVSRLSIRSRTAESEGASLIRCEGDRLEPVSPASGPVGTSVTVRNLFFNTPARRKFLRTPVTERTHCLDVARSLAMSHPRIGMTVMVDGKAVLDEPPNQSARQRVLGVLGAELAGEMLEANADGLDDARGLAMWGLVGLPSLARATMKSQFVYLNGRPIRDRTVQHALREAYRGLIEPGRFPTAAIMLEMDPSSVDVNVHPAKTEVRFRDSSMVHGVVLRAVREALMRADLTPRATGVGEQRGAAETGWRSHGDGVLPTGSPAGGGADRAAGFLRQPPSGHGQERLSYEALRDAIAQSGRVAREGRIAEPASEEGGEFVPKPAERVLQVHNSYLVTQDEAGIIIIDQHALHERVMFEHLTARITRGPLESQRLLMPVVVPMTGAQIDLLGSLAPLLERLGIGVEPIGPASVAVQSFPTFLFERGVEAGPFVTELVERAEAEGFTPDREEALHEILDMMSCKAAVKAGDRMSEAELRELLRLRAEVERSSNCPHGRPTSIRVTIGELERRFGRT